MRSRRFWAAGLLIAAGGLVPPGATGAAMEAGRQVCAQFGTATVAGGRYVVQNNEWNDTTPQCLRTGQDGFAISAADHHMPTGGPPAGYPSIYAGCHYGTCSSGSGLPMAVGGTRFATVTTTVSMRYPASGEWDAGYDIWFDPTPRTDGQNTGAELMVWLNHRGTPRPVGTQVGVVDLAGGSWAVWYGDIGWHVVSYVRSTPAGSVRFAVRDFYQDMVARGYAQPSWYLTSVQVGFEPWVGGAGLSVSSFGYRATPAPAGG